MSKINYILKSFKFYKKQHLALIMACIISTAVITGALVVGDSVDYSLKQIVEKRLGKIEFVMQSKSRFFRKQLANDISDFLNVKAEGVLMLNASATNPENEFRKNNIQINGIDSGFWSFADKNLPQLNSNEVFIGSNLANELQLNKDDEIVLRIERIEVVPLNSPFSSDNSNYISVRCKILDIFDESSFSTFSLKNNQSATFNVFASAEYLSSKLEIQGLTNTIVVSQDSLNSLSNEELDYAFSQVWKLLDAGLILNNQDTSDYAELSSNRIFIDENITEKIINSDIENKTYLTYLINSIKTKTDTTPYSFVTATSIEINGEKINDNEIIINEWLANDLNAKSGDTITIDYFVIDPLQSLKEESHSFVIKQIIPIESKEINRTLMPEFPGFSEATSCNNWDANIPIDLDRIRDKDENYWDDYKGTPKAIISIEKGKEIWGNKYGNYTAIRFQNSELDKKQLEEKILSFIEPKDLNLQFTSAKKDGIKAANSGVDFGELFLSLSFFVILAALILIIVIYNLNSISRKHETGLLFSLGFTKRQISNISVYENMLTVFIGSLIGVFVGILFNYAILNAINSAWNDIVRTNMLEVLIKPGTLLTGLLSSFEIAMITIFIVSYRNLRSSTINILNNTNSLQLRKLKRKKLISTIFASLLMIVTISIIIYSIQTSVDINASLFLSAGGMFMIASLIFVRNIIISRKGKTEQLLSISKISFKNSRRNIARTMTVLILLALGTFVVIITGANRLSFVGAEKLNSSGTGGFTFWTETTVPILNDINTDYGKEKLGLNDYPELNNIEFLQFYSFDGDDASCLNLNQIANPRIIAFDPQTLQDRGSFSFAYLLDSIDKENPWLELNKIYAENVIPAFADQTVITWGLMKKLGDTLTYTNERGEKLNLIIVGGLDASILQGNIFISEDNFFKHFPSSDGSKLMLIDTRDENEDELRNILSENLQDYGIDISKTNDRLAKFNSVTNTYMSVFMILGALGVLIATIGLGIILYKNLLDRKQELALLMATGYPKQTIFKLIFTENLLLIALGTSIGLISAFIGILPSLLSESFNIPETFLFLLIIIIVLNSILWTYFPIRKSLKRNIISSLRNE